MGTTVLIIEDERAIADLIKDRLDMEGYKTQVAYTGSEAYKDIKDNKPDVITLDIYMPDANGLNILKDLKSDPKTDKIPVIIISSSNEEKNAIGLGAGDFVKKPINFPKLFEALQKAKAQIKEKEQFLHKKGA